MSVAAGLPGPNDLPLERLARSLGAGAVAGGVAGVLVGGVGGRLAMRISGAMTDPGLQGVARTENGNIVGQVTLDGTVGLVFFGGLFIGVLAGVMFAAARPWLMPLGRWDGLAFGLLILASVGSVTVLEPDNFDFRRFGSPQLNVIMFAALFPLFGVALAAALRVLEARAEQGGIAAAVAWLGLIPAGLLVAIFVLIGAIQALTGEETAGDPRQYVLIYWLVVTLTSRVAIRRGRVLERAGDLSRGQTLLTYGLLLLPVASGLPGLVSAVAALARP